ncbi:MAG: hypothetical protein ABDH37_01120 [Candidatus Hydrothermales bacterium]
MEVKKIYAFIVYNYEGTTNTKALRVRGIKADGNAVSWANITKPIDPIERFQLI